MPEPWSISIALPYAPARPAEIILPAAVLSGPAPAGPENIEAGMECFRWPVNGIDAAAKRAFFFFAALGTGEEHTGFYDLASRARSSRSLLYISSAPFTLSIGINGNIRAAFCLLMMMCGLGVGCVGAFLQLVGVQPGLADKRFEFANFPGSFFTYVFYHAFIGRLQVGHLLFEESDAGGKGWMLSSDGMKGGDGKFHTAAAFYRVRSCIGSACARRGGQTAKLLSTRELAMVSASGSVPRARCGRRMKQPVE